MSLVKGFPGDDVILIVGSHLLPFYVIVQSKLIFLPLVCSVFLLFKKPKDFLEEHFGKNGLGLEITAILREGRG